MAEETQSDNIAVIKNDLQYIKRDLSDIKGKLENDYVTREEFAPIKNLVYGVVSLILVAFVGGLITLVLRN